MFLDTPWFSSFADGRTGLFADGTAAAPSISFSADSDTGFYRSAANNVTFSSNGVNALKFADSGLTFTPNGINAGFISNVGAGGGLALVALGTNQNITLTPNGTGFVSPVNLNVTGTLGGASGTGVTLSYETAVGQLQTWGGKHLSLNPIGNNVLIGTTTNSGALLQVNGTATFAGTIQPQLATTAGAPAYVKGAIYFDTTLNKLRVGGASAWETITSV
jgi:hypothetical protein